MEGAGLPLWFEPSTLRNGPFHGPLNGPTVHFQRPGKGLGSLGHVIVKFPKFPCHLPPSLSIILSTPHWKLWYRLIRHPGTQPKFRTVAHSASECASIQSRFQEFPGALHEEVSLGNRMAMASICLVTAPTLRAHGPDQGPSRSRTRQNSMHINKPGPRPTRPPGPRRKNPS